MSPINPVSSLGSLTLSTKRSKFPKSTAPHRLVININTLPNECLVLVLARFPLPQLLRLRETCPRWCSLVEYHFLHPRTSLNIFLCTANVKESFSYSMMDFYFCGIIFSPLSCVNWKNDASVENDAKLRALLCNRIARNDDLLVREGRAVELFTMDTVQSLVGLFPNVTNLLVYVGRTSPGVEVISALLSAWANQLASLYLVSFNLPTTDTTILDPYNFQPNIPWLHKAISQEECFSSGALHQAVAQSAGTMHTLGLLSATSWIETNNSVAQTANLLKQWGVAVQAEREQKEATNRDKSAEECRIAVDHHPLVMRRLYWMLKSPPGSPLPPEYRFNNHMVKIRNNGHIEPLELGLVLSNNFYPMGYMFGQAGFLQSSEELCKNPNEAFFYHQIVSNFVWYRVRARANVHRWAQRFNRNPSEFHNWHKSTIRSVGPMIGNAFGYI